MERFGVVLSLVCVAFGVVNCENYNVLEFGAKGDGATDDSTAFGKAWEVACGGVGKRSIQIPFGKTFMLQPLVFRGPCKSPVLFRLEGKIVAPSNKDAWSSCDSGKWIGFSDVRGLTVAGSGLIDGRGSSFWQQESIKENSGKCDRPTALHFHGCTELEIRGITSMNSPRNHISINQCDGVSISNVRLLAPEDSPNTDGIDISASTRIDIFDSFIGTGDDCVAINTGSAHVNITSVICGPGHGISVGSLGNGGETSTLEDVHVRDCTFNRTTNGARIKTWPGGKGYARDISFEHITVVEAKNPIIIDQYYSEGGGGGGESAENSAVAISGVIFRGFNGTTIDDEAIMLNCSKIRPCTNVLVDKVNIVMPDGTQPLAVCNNLKGTLTSTVPKIICSP